MNKNTPPAPVIENEELKKDKYNDEFYFKILNKNRYILLYDEISNCVADVIVTKIKAMNLIDSKKEITIEINSAGGELSCGFSIINAIEQSIAPVNTIISGQVCSMAALISIVGKKRSIYYNSYWMQHPLSEGQADYLNFIKDRTKFLIHLDKMTETVLKKYTKLSKSDIRKIETGELWLSADECLKKGIADKIIK
ncbi:MAG: ATP-dependent Clp protease proteolytic subunit [Patescibacteria group bacterium]